jgi:cytochrome oxidase Cu insertion factor (SCO1/SenC/PrrC family)
MILIAAAITGGLLVTFGYRSLLIEQAKIREKTNRLPFISRLEDNLVATERSGQKVALGDLRGKVLVAGHVFTRCPRGCSGLAKIMADLEDEFKSEPDFHMLSFSVDPEHDDAEALRSFADLHEIKGDRWWFLTDNDDPGSIRRYLVGQFRFEPVREVPEEERTSAFDLFVHDMRLALVDRGGHVRGYYDVLDQKQGVVAYRALVQDIKRLLDEKAPAS